VPAYSYDDFERAVREQSVDAVFIALPNTLHRHYTERAAAIGAHVLCEKPMATTEEDCLAMIEACAKGNVKTSQQIKRPPAQKEEPWRPSLRIGIEAASESKLQLVSNPIL
jgi:hypothetical protein